jgi:polyhydroxybutyrate depolymerase
MTYRLGCELSDRIAAIAVVSSSVEVKTCSPAHPPSVLHIHGTADTNVPYKGGTGGRSVTRLTHEPVATTVSGWVQRTGANPAPQVTYRQGRVTCETYRAAAGTDVTLCTVDGGGHTWPGGSDDKDGSGFPASQYIWDFFASHPRR